MPEIVRFISEDPHPGIIQLRGTHNSRYIYVLNNPNKFRDPTGKFFDPVTWIVIGAIVGGLDAALNYEGSDGNFLEHVLLGAAKGAVAGGAIAATFALGGTVGGGSLLFKVGYQSALNRKGGFVDNFISSVQENTFASMLTGVGGDLLVMGNYTNIILGETILGLGLLGDDILDSACDEETGTQASRSVCDRPNLINILL